MKGSILRELRENAGLTQKELGNEVGLSDSTIRMMELDKRDGTKKNVQKIAQYFNVSVEYLNGNINSDVNCDTDNELNKFLKVLIDEGVIKDPDNIPKDIETIIMYNIKKELNKIIKSR